MQGYRILLHHHAQEPKATIITTSGYVLDTLPIVQGPDVPSLDKLSREKKPQVPIYLQLNAQQVYIGASPPIQAVAVSRGSSQQVTESMVAYELALLTTTQELLEKGIEDPSTAFFRLNLLERLQAFLVAQQAKVNQEIEELKQAQVVNQQVQEALPSQPPYRTSEAQPTIQALGMQLDEVAHTFLTEHPNIDPQAMHQEASPIAYKLPLTVANYHRILLDFAYLNTLPLHTPKQALTYYKTLQALRQAWALVVQEGPDYCRQRLGEEAQAILKQLQGLRTTSQQLFQYLGFIQACLQHAKPIEQFRQSYTFSELAVTMKLCRDYFSQETTPVPQAPPLCLAIIKNYAN